MHAPARSPGLPVDRARRRYDRMGKSLDLGDAFEARAKRRALDLLAPATGERIVELGTGTGLGALDLLARTAPDGVVDGVDVSPVMLAIARTRADEVGFGERLRLHERPARDTGLAPGADAVFSTYTLDLMTDDDIDASIAEALRLLRPGGRAVFCGMTPPRGGFARLLMGLWGVAYRLGPEAMGGCRPLELVPRLEAAGFVSVERETIEQLGFPSEIVRGRRRAEP